MVKRTTSTKDLEKLSAYLDEQLKPSERTRLEERLRRDAHLDRELKSLRRTRAVLRSLPLRKAPRNFTLTARMVPVKQAPAFRPQFGLISAMAVLVLVMVMIGDFFVIPDYLGMFQISQAPRVSEEMAAADTVLEEEPLIFPTERPAPAEAEALEAPVEQPMAEVEAVAPAAEMAQKVPAGTPEVPVLESARSAADEMPTTEEAMLFTLQVTPTPGTAGMGTLEVQQIPTEAVSLLAETQEAGTQVEEPALLAEPAPSRTDLWVQLLIWMLELLLVIVALGSIAAAVYMRMKKQS